MVHEFLNKNDVEAYRKNALKHINVVFELENNHYICFFDMLSYGTIKVETKEMLEIKLSKIGPDFLDLSITPEIFLEKIRKRTIIKT